MPLFLKRAAKIYFGIGLFAVLSFGNGLYIVQIFLFCPPRLFNYNFTDKALSIAEHEHKLTRLQDLSE